MSSLSKQIIWNTQKNKEVRKKSHHIEQRKSFHILLLQKQWDCRSSLSWLLLHTYHDFGFQIEQCLRFFFSQKDLKRTVTFQFKHKLKMPFLVYASNNTLNDWSMALCSSADFYSHDDPNSSFCNPQTCKVIGAQNERKRMAE